MSETLGRSWLIAAALLSVAGGAGRAAQAIAPVPGSAELTRCNGFNDAAVAWEAVRAGSQEPVALRSLTPPVLLPDGREFKTWEEPPEHRRTFFVAQEHAQAADENPGSEQRPWKTIGRAAAQLAPGDRVIVKRGLYREWVRPARGGTGPRRMITYETAPGEQVIVSGSERLEGRWMRGAPAGQAETWTIELPEGIFPGYNPFRLSNVSANMLTQKAAVKQGWDKPPYTLPRGLVFQDGRRLKQVVDREGLAGAPGAYWVEPGGRRLHVRPLDDKDPSQRAFEVTTRPFAFAPERAGLGFIRVAGFIVERVANCYPVPQLGAISTRQGHHWIVDRNTVRQVNGLGLDYGRRQTFLPYEVPPDTPRLAGVGTIVRGNRFLQCGVSAMEGLGLIGGLIEGNYAEDCAWHDVESLWEAAGIKLHYLKHVLVRRNVVNGTTGAAGLWVDHSNANVRITQNVVVGARTRSSGGFFLEASYLPNLIDNNIVWDCEGHAFYQHDCGDLTLANNLFGCCSKQPVFMARPGKGRSRLVDLETGRVSAVVNNRVVGNVFYGFGDRGTSVPKELGNESDDNVFVNPPEAKPLDLAALRQKTGCEGRSRSVTATVEFSSGRWTLRGLLPTLAVPRLDAVTCDYFDTPRSGATTDAGPFLRANVKLETELFRPGATPNSPFPPDTR